MGVSEDVFRRLVENFPDGIVFVYEDTDPIRYCFVGGRGLESIGLTKEQLEGQPVADGRPPAVREQIRSQYRRAIGGEEVTFETEAEGKHFRFQLSPIEDDVADRPNRAAGIAQDITEQVAYEQELERRAEQLKKYARLVFHDIRNPLNVAKGHVEILANEIDTGTEHVEQIRSSLNRIESLTDEDAGIGEIKTAQFDHVSVDDIAESSWQNVATGAATLTVDADRVIAADEKALRRLFENLFRNAIAHAGDAPLVRIGLLDSGFFLEDTGPGIPPEERDSVFERGYSLGDGNGGLGLFIVKNVADSHGWAVEAAESPGGGARFEFTDVQFQS